MVPDDKDKWRPDVRESPQNRLAHIVAQLIDSGEVATQDECAKRLGLTASYLSQILSGKKPVSRKTAHLVQLAFGVNERFLSNGEQPERLWGHNGHRSHAPPAAHRNERTMHVRPIAERRWVCGHCGGEVREGAECCMHCLTPIDWGDEEKEGVE